MKAINHATDMRHQIQNRSNRSKHQTLQTKGIESAWIKKNYVKTQKQTIKNTYNKQVSKTQKKNKIKKKSHTRKKNVTIAMH